MNDEQEADIRMDRVAAERFFGPIMEGDGGVERISSAAPGPGEGHPRAARLEAARATGGRGRRARLRDDLRAPPPGALPLLPGDPAQPGRRRGRAAVDDVEGAAGAAGGGREIRLRPWLFRVAHNESIAILRERQPAASGSRGPRPAGGVEPEAAAERSERLRTLVSDLKQLPDRQRSALVMRELSGLGYAEIAAALDCGEGAARQTVYEARVALQTRAEGRQMECEEARRAISAGDRRRLRGRKLRAHLSGCDGCSDFEAAIAARRAGISPRSPRRFRSRRPPGSSPGSPEAAARPGPGSRPSAAAPAASPAASPVTPR